MTDDAHLSDARALITPAIDKAEDIGMRGGIATVGASGALVSASRMDHGGAGGMGSLQDVLARRPTEIATLNGGIVRAAEGRGVPTSLNQAIAGLISGLENSWSA